MRVQYGPSDHDADDRPSSGHYNGQWCQDRLLEPLFAHVKPGTGFFVESGARDGEAQSNTLYYEKNKGWTGLLVEPSPTEFGGILKRNRHSWAFLGGLSTKRGDNDDAAVRQFSGIRLGGYWYTIC